MKEKLLSFSSIFSAIFAALCWSGPLILATLGLGSIGSAYFAGLTRYKPIFVIITGILLYRAYSIMEKKGADKKTQLIFWVSAVASILILYSPNIIMFFQR